MGKTKKQTENSACATLFNYVYYSNKYGITKLTVLFVKSYMNIYIQKIKTHTSCQMHIVVTWFSCLIAIFSNRW